MLRRHLISALPVLALPNVPRAQGRTEIVVQYPSPQNFKEVMEAVVAEFERRNPEIRISLRAPYRYYDEGMQTLLREAVARQMPHVSFQALNRIELLAERRVIQRLDQFLSDAREFEAGGWTPALRSLGQVGAAQYGLAFAASTPITYYNPELVRRAGGDPDAFPRDWDGVIALAARIRALGGDTLGMHFRFQEDDWMFQALIFAQGGEMLTTDGRIAFDGAEGRQAVRLLRRFVAEGGQSASMNPNQAFQSFYAGQLGIQFHSTARLGNMLRGVGERFAMRTAAFPGAAEGRGRLPTGGMAGVITTQDPSRNAAAWRFLSFATGPEAAAMVVRQIGYLPTNNLAVTDPRHLGDFYDRNPLHMAAVRQIPLMRPWFAFPGNNGLRITDLIIEQNQAIADGRVTPEVGLATMAREAAALMPRR